MRNYQHLLELGSSYICSFAYKWPCGLENIIIFTASNVFIYLFFTSSVVLESFF